MRLLSVADAWQDKSEEKYEEEEEEEERLETVAEVTPCCRETEESDEMHKTEQFLLLHS